MSEQLGQPIRQYSYSAFGAPEDHRGDSQPYRFTGREWDKEVGLYYHRARYQSPRLGRFLQQDPVDIQNGTNLYAYARSNPLKYIDPNGLADIKVDGQNIRVHKYDVDPWPSKPHGHIYEKNQVVDTEGRTSDKSTGKQVGQLSKAGKKKWTVFLAKLGKAAASLGAFIGVLCELFIDVSEAGETPEELEEFILPGGQPQTQP